MPQGPAWFFGSAPPSLFPFARARGCWGADSLQACLPFGWWVSKVAIRTGIVIQRGQPPKGSSHTFVTFLIFHVSFPRV
jgi:hypothetical protein